MIDIYTDGESMGSKREREEGERQTGKMEGGNAAREHTGIYQHAYL
jgi:hypothetical protein